MDCTIHLKCGLKPYSDRTSFPSYNSYLLMSVTYMTNISVFITEVLCVFSRCGFLLMRSSAVLACITYNVYVF